MDSQAKILQLKNSITHSLRFLIGKKCILLDAPYYHNIGDVLIWKGEMAFLKEHYIQCLYTASYETCTFPKIAKDVTVLFNGGGNLGDIYPEHMKFLQEVVQKYPNNRIVICPQTVYYADNLRMNEDFQRLMLHGDLYFCARDKMTHALLSGFFNERAILLPDMAFCISEKDLDRYKSKESKSKLVIERKDCESLNERQCSSQVADVSDWPTFEHSFHRTTFLNKILKRLSDLHIPFLTPCINRFWNYYFRHHFAEMMFKEGVRFISPYRQIETTRLHGCILSILLGKEVTLVDNSYGKNRNFYHTWLTDLDSITLKVSTQ